MHDQDSYTKLSKTTVQITDYSTSVVTAFTRKFAATYLGTSIRTLGHLWRASNSTAIHVTKSDS